MSEHISLQVKIIDHLLAQGYEHPEPIPASGGAEWTHPDWDGSTDRLYMAIADCLDRESGS